MEDDLVLPNNDLVVEGDLVVRDADGVVRFRFDRETSSLFVYDEHGNLVFQWEMQGRNLRFGGHGRDGDFVIFAGTATNLSDLTQATFHFDSQGGTVRMGGNGVAGRLVCLDGQGNQTVLLNGAAGSAVGRRFLLRQALLRLGAANDDGDIQLYAGGNTSVEDPSMSPSLHLNAGTSSLTGQRFLLRQALLRLGAANDDGDIQLFRGTNTSADSPSEEATIHLDGQSGDIRLRSISFADGSRWSSAPDSTITAVVAGEGLSGGGSVGTVELSFSNQFIQLITNMGARIQSLETAVAAL
jgi:hypothetical protein